MCIASFDVSARIHVERLKQICVVGNRTAARELQEATHRQPDPQSHMSAESEHGAVAHAHASACIHARPTALSFKTRIWG